MTIGFRARQVRPGLEALEGRQLLSSVVGGEQTPSAVTVSAPPRVSPLRRLVYTAPGGGRVLIQMFGVGNMDGTSVDSDGALNLRFSGTNQETGILARVVGGTGVAPVRSVRSLNLPSGSLTGVGGSLIDIVDLHNFDLVAGGRINLTPGVHVLSLNSAAADTQINLREVPENTTVTSTSGLSSSTTSSTSTTGATSTTGTTTSNTGSTSVGISSGGTTTNGTTTGGLSTSGSSAGTTTATSTTSASSTTFTTSTTTTSGATTTVSTVLPSSTTQNGQTLTYAYSSTGGQTLTGISGRFVPGANVVLQNITYGSPNPQPGAPPAPPGVVIAINHVNGPASGTTPTTGDAQIYGYDRVAGTLIRFDTVTGAQTQTIPLAGILPDTNVEAGVALAVVNNALLVLVNDGSTIYAFHTTDGTPAGSFSLASLKAADGLTNPLRLGTFDNQTVIADPAGGANSLGVIQPIDVAASLKAGQAKASLDASGNPIPAYSLTRAFGLSGGLSGVAGSDTLFAIGGGKFDPFQPNRFLLGLSSLGFANTSTGVVSFGELTRAAVTKNSGSTIYTNSNGATGSSLDDALGSIGQNLALYTGQTTTSNGATVDQVTLINPVSNSQGQTISLNDANPLASLSGSYRPTLAGLALVDVQGNTQSFKATSTQGLVFNGEGNVNLVKIAHASDTLIIGYPFGHAAIPDRSNVTIASSSRVVGTRNGVIVLPSIQPTGPLFLPTP